MSEGRDNKQCFISVKQQVLRVKLYSSLYNCLVANQQMCFLSSGDKRSSLGHFYLSSQNMRVIARGQAWLLGPSCGCCPSVWCWDQPWPVPLLAPGLVSPGLPRAVACVWSALSVVRDLFEKYTTWNVGLVLLAWGRGLGSLLRRFKKKKKKKTFR